MKPKHTPKGKLLSVIKQFKDKKIAVIGDIFLDSYAFGRVLRINPERVGYPLLTIQKEEHRLGGAANVAVNLSSLGAQTILFGIVGDDQPGTIVKELCKKRKIALHSFPENQTIIKQRWIELSHNDYFGRADFGETNLAPISDKAAQTILTTLQKEQPDAIILSDYNKSVFKNTLATKVINWARQSNTPVIVDPKPVNIDSFKGAHLLSPNLGEAQQAAGITDLHTPIAEIVKAFKKHTNAEHVVVTCGSKGIATYDTDFHMIPTQAREVFDVSGAGDTVTALLALGSVSSISLPESALLANVAAGIVCGKVGTATVTRKTLFNAIAKLSEPDMNS